MKGKVIIKCEQCMDNASGGLCNKHWEELESETQELQDRISQHVENTRVLMAERDKLQTMVADLTFRLEEAQDKELD